jgi:putative hemolysin
MSSSLTVPARTHQPVRGYTATVTNDTAAVLAAKRLRHTVFSAELGVSLDGQEPGVDTDRFDEVCDHLIVEESATGSVVGTYRLLPPGRTDRLYSDGEFDLSALSGLRGHLVEAGRSCVHPDHRSGAVINLMWRTLAGYLLASGRRWLAGCASIPLADGGAAASHTWALARAKHLAPPEFRVTPRHPWTPRPVATRPTYASVPALLRGYLRLGAWVCGPPAHDPEFGVADLFVLLSLDRVDPRYARHFLEQAR